jgi:hypothetical protein
MRMLIKAGHLVLVTVERQSINMALDYFKRET